MAVFAMPLVKFEASKNWSLGLIKNLLLKV
jgi:hypothetical protein